VTVVVALAVAPGSRALAQSNPGTQSVPEEAELPGRPAATAPAEPLPAPEGAGPAPSEAPATPAAPPEPRITFTLPFPEEQGGGQATGSAAALDYQREDFALLSGGVELHYQDVTLRAQQVSVDLGSKELTAQGNVIIDQGPSRLTGSSATYDLDTKTGSLRDASAVAPQGIHFSGDRIDKVGDDEFVVDNGIFTSCEGAVPPWSFRLGHARIRLESYARVRNASMRVKALPILYVPYMVWPTKTERASGLLIPKVGSSNDRGAYLGLAYYQTLGRSWDATLYADLFSKDYLAGGTEVRYHPTEGTRGRLRGWAIDDPLQEDLRWKMSWEHDTRDLPLGLRGVVAFEDYSDDQFFRDFERGLDDKARSSVYSQAFLSGSWGAQSFNLKVDQRETLGLSPDTLRQLPEVEYRLRPTRLGKSPLYLSLDSAAHFLSVERGSGLSGEYERFHLEPALRLPLAPAPWLSLTLTAGERLTWYGDTVGVVDGRQAFLGESLTRAVPSGGAELIGPSFSRIFGSRPGAPGRVKHVIEPRFEWAYGRDFEDQALVPFFDEIDSVASRNVGRFALINRVLAKPRPAEEGKPPGPAREVFSLEVARGYSFDEERPLETGDGEQSEAGPLEVILRAYPSQRFSLRLDGDYSLLFGQLTGLRASGNLAFGRQQIDFTWTPRWQATTGEVLTNQGSLGLKLQPFASRRLTLATLLNYDFDRSLLRDQRHLLTFAGSCWALRLELHESTTLVERRRDYLFSVDLKNVGTFLDLTGGDTEEGL
jgi:LPS-assembly protein